MMRRLSFVVLFLLLLFCPCGNAKGIKLEDSCKTGIKEGPLFHTPESLTRENLLVEEERFSRFVDDQDLEIHKFLGELVHIPASLDVDIELQEKFRFVRPHTALFLEALNAEFEACFHRPLRVNSAVRTKEKQRGLIKAKNWNAAPVDGPKSSTHLSGATVDLGKLRFPERMMNWLRKRLLTLKEEGVIEVTEEKYQAVFHVLVSRKWIEKHQPP